MEQLLSMNISASILILILLVLLPGIHLVHLLMFPSMDI